MTRPEVIRKVQALLDEAASTTFAEEAEVFLAKAQELMTREAIDEAILAASGRQPAEPVVVQELVVRGPYASARTSLLAATLRANGCRLVLRSGGRGDRHCTAVGHRSDIAGAVDLYHALTATAIREMHSAAVPPGEGLRTFRRSFLLSFAQRIGERLRRSATYAEAAAAAGRPARSVELVLASRAAAVDRALRESFPHLGTSRTSSSSIAGLHSGRVAADRAALGATALRSVTALPR